MPKITLNGQELEFQPRQTVIQVALENRVVVPHYCWHPALSVVASCRICQVEVHGPGPKRLTTACNTECVDGMVVVTDTAAVTKARAGNLEDLLLNHPLDCPICDKAGECWLQDYAYEYGAGVGRNDFVRRRLKKRVPISERIVLDQERCILCTRCVRFTDEIAQKPELIVADRGEHSVIEIFPGQPLSSNYQGNLADICPVGALTLSDFRFKNRVWWLKETDSVCTLCSRGCSIMLDTRHNEINRVRPRTNPQVNGWFICDIGRFGLPGAHHPEGRLTATQIGGAPAEPDAAAARLAAELSAAAREGGEILVVASPQSTCEELFLLRELFARTAAFKGRATLGYLDVPKEEGDGILFTGERAANVRGLELFAYTRLRAADVEQRLGRAHVAWVFDERVTAPARGPRFLAVQAMTSPLAAAADVVLPGTSVAETEGTLINTDKVVQRVRPALRPPDGVMPHFRTLLAVAGELGVLDLPRTPGDAFVAWADQFLDGDNLTLAGLDRSGMRHDPSSARPREAMR